MLDDGGSGQAVEVITVSEDAEHGGASSSPMHTPRTPGSPGILATAHVRTKVQPPLANAAGLSGTYTIVRRFEFSAEKQRNVVVVRKPDGSLHVMAKGSPEMMCKLSGEAGRRALPLRCWQAGWQAGWLAGWPAGWGSTWYLPSKDFCLGSPVQPLCSLALRRYVTAAARTELPKPAALRQPRFLDCCATPLTCTALPPCALWPCPYRAQCLAACRPTLRQSWGSTRGRGCACWGWPRGSCRG